MGGENRIVDRYYAVPYPIEGLDQRLFEETRVKHPRRLACALFKALGVYTGTTKDNYDPADDYFIQRDDLTVQIFPVPSKLEAISRSKDSALPTLPSIFVRVSSPEGSMFSSEGRRVIRLLDAVGNVLTANYYAKEKKPEEVVTDKPRVHPSNIDIKKIFGLSSHSAA